MVVTVLTLVALVSGAAVANRAAAAPGGVRGRFELCGGGLLVAGLLLLGVGLHAMQG
jgi:hypothetical protein